MTIRGTQESHFSVLFMLDEQSLIDLLAECKHRKKAITIGIVIDSKDAKYKTVSDSRVSIEILALAGDSSDTCIKE